MFLYRITLTRYTAQLIASGRAARWNPNDVEMIYTASSRSLACLENVVHRTRFGLNQLFSVLTIECPDEIKPDQFYLKDLPESWTDYEQMHVTQHIGEEWIKKNKKVLLQVPSSIINEEFNYLINPKHKDFSKIKIVNTQPFVFDKRIKM